MKVHPIIISPPQLMEELEQRRFFLPLRIEIPYQDFHRVNINAMEMLRVAAPTLKRLNYALSSHRNEAAHDEVFTATQRDPIQHLLRAEREATAAHLRTPPQHLYRDMGLAEQEVRIAYLQIHLHVRNEQHCNQPLPLDPHDFPSSWQQPRYEWCRADARPPRTSSVPEWANERLGIPFDTSVLSIDDDARAAIQATTIARLAEVMSPPGSQTLRDFLEQQGRELADGLGIPSAMLQALRETAGNGGQIRPDIATPASVAPPPPPKPPTLLLQPKGRYLTLTNP